MSDIYINRHDQQLGPFPKEEVPDLVASGKFAWDDLAWTEGMERWGPLHRAVAFDPARPVTLREEVAEEPAGFFRELPRAFAYPFSGSSGWIILFCGTVMVFMRHVVGIVPLLGWIAYVLLTGYLFAYLFSVVRDSAIGEKDVAEFPSISDAWEDLLMPVCRVVGTFLGCQLPAVGAAVALGTSGHLEQWVWLPLALAGVGLFCFPMSLLTVVIFNSVAAALNPAHILPSVARVFPRYLVIVMLLFGTLVAITLLGELAIYILGDLLAMPLVAFLGFYSLIVQARILGLIYRTNEEALGWFSHEPR